MNPTHLFATIASTNTLRYAALALCALAFAACGEGETGKTFACTEEGVRKAVAEGGGVHTFDCDGPTLIDLGAAIEIPRDVKLDGEGDLALSSGMSHRVFVVASDVRADLRNMAILDGHEARASQGGAIYNEGHLTLRSCLVQGSSAIYGGGVFNDRGTLVVIESEIIENSASYGGGVYNYGGVFEMTGGRLADNVASALGGGLRNEPFVSGDPVTYEGSAELTSVLVRNNEAVEGAGLHNGATLEIDRSTIVRNGFPNLLDETTEGGGIWNSMTLIVRDSTIDSNNAWYGGGIYTTDYARIHRSMFIENDAPVGGAIYSIDELDLGIAIVQLENSTFWSNGTAGAAAGSSFGGAIYSADADLDLFFVTFAANHATTGSALRTLDGDVALGGTYIEGACANAGATYVSDYSFSSTPTCSNVVWIDEALPLVAVPADNGGPTLTSAILSESLVDVIPVDDCVDWNGHFVSTDQRGGFRAYRSDLDCDMGAFEVVGLR